MGKIFTLCHKILHKIWKVLVIKFIARSYTRGTALWKRSWSDVGKTLRNNTRDIIMLTVVSVPCI